ncbi:MAG: 4-hydroxy-tetrahydrodipicolinate reductase [Deltaproteobacteria bacterium]|nr:MAG: 4-hydroxy-tetrahydrodipicolinate reductase [Deltaproteobacteria bacterium]
MRLAVPGAGGRMGRHVVAEALARPDAFAIAAAIEAEDSPAVGAEVAPGIVATSDRSALAGADVYVDFTTPEATRALAEAAAECGTAAVVGTTGLDDAARAALDALARRAPVVVAANFSMGVTLMLALVEQAARALGPEFDLEVVEIHHRHKRDAPSGTALAIAEALARGRGVDLRAVGRFAREGDIGPRPAGEIGVSTVRGGDVPGDHTALFLGPEERLELVHRAGSRAIFARGALRAAEWVVGRPAGLYSMRDVLGL